MIAVVHILAYMREMKKSIEHLFGKLQGKTLFCRPGVNNIKL
jgi:hypothetical protein